MLNSESNSSSFSLSEIDDKILSIKSIISYQKEEILKSERSILIFEKCLDQQNEALNKFINEKDKLEFDRSKRIKLSNNDEQKFIGKNESSVNRKKRKINRNTFKVFDKDADIDNHEPAKVDCSENLKAEMITQTITKTISNTKMKVNVNSQTPLKKLTIVHSSDQTITKIAVSGSDIFLGGSRGLLLHYNPRNTTIFDTKTKEEITQVEIVKRATVSYLIGFTKEKILIFEGMGGFCREECLSGIGQVFNDVSVIYIPSAGAKMRKFYVSSGKFVDHPVNISGQLCCFVPGTGSNKSALVSLQDGRLYITEKNDLRTLEVVPGVENVRGIMRIRYSNFLCYSDRNVWIFDPKFELLERHEYEDGVKLVEVTYTCGAVVDGGDKVHGYRVQDSGCFGTEVSVRTVEASVTALCIAKRNVLVAVGSEVFEIANMF